MRTPFSPREHRFPGANGNSSAEIGVSQPRTVIASGERRSSVVHRRFASDPPTQSEVQSVIYKLNELIGGLHRPA